VVDERQSHWLWPWKPRQQRVKSHVAADPTARDVISYSFKVPEVLHWKATPNSAQMPGRRVFSISSPNCCPCTVQRAR